MSISPTDANGLLRFLKGEADTFGLPTELPKPSDSDNLEPQWHPSHALLAELRAARTGRIRRAVAVLALAAVAGLGLTGVLSFDKGALPKSPPAAEIAPQPVAKPIPAPSRVEPASGSQAATPILADIDRQLKERWSARPTVAHKTLPRSARADPPRSQRRPIPLRDLTEIPAKSQSAAFGCPPSLSTVCGLDSWKE
jgi:hypothetical protein